MFRQPPHRGQRSKGFKVKHVLQICLVLGISIWLIYQVKRSRENKVSNEESIKTENVVKFGRKDLPQLDETVIRDVTHKADEVGARKPEEKNDVSQIGTRTDIHENVQEIMEDSVEPKGNPVDKKTREDINEKIGEENAGNEGEKEYQEKEETESKMEVTEEIKDPEIEVERNEGNNVKEGEAMINEESKEDGGEQSQTDAIKEATEERRTAESNGEQTKGANSKGSGSSDERKDKTEEGAREENYKGDDASSAVSQETQNITGENEETGLDNSDEAENLLHHERIELEQDSKQKRSDDIDANRNESLHNVVESYLVEKNSYPNTTGRGDGNESAEVDSQFNSTIASEFSDEPHLLSENHVLSGNNGKKSISSVTRKDSQKDKSVPKEFLKQEKGKSDSDPTGEQSDPSAATSAITVAENGNLAVREYSDSNLSNEKGIDTSESARSDNKFTDFTGESDTIAKNENPSTNYGGNGALSNENGNLMQKHVSTGYSNENATQLVLSFNKTGNLSVFQKPQVHWIDSSNSRGTEASSNADGSGNSTQNENESSVLIVSNGNDMAAERDDADKKSLWTEASLNSGHNAKSNEYENKSHLQIMTNGKQKIEGTGDDGQKERVKTSNLRSEGVSNSNDNDDSGDNGNGSFLQSNTDDSENRKANRDALQNDQVDSPDSQGQEIASENGKHSNVGQQDSIDNSDSSLPQEVKEARMDLETLPDNTVEVNAHDDMASE